MATFSISSIPMVTNPIISHYSCGTCGGECFPNVELHREHYRSEWHRYNLKRRVAGLPHISQHDFVTKAALFASSIASSGTDSSSGSKTNSNISSNKIISSSSTAASTTTAASTAIECKQCNKRFFSTNSLADHLKSARHRETAKRFVSTSPAPEIVSSPAPTGGSDSACVPQQLVIADRESHQVLPGLHTDKTIVPPCKACPIKPINPSSSPPKVKSSEQKEQKSAARRHWNPTRVLNRAVSSTSDGENEWEDCDDEDEVVEIEEDNSTTDQTVPSVPEVAPSTVQQEPKPQERERTPPKPVILLLGDCLFCKARHHTTPDAASTSNPRADCETSSRETESPSICPVASAPAVASASHSAKGGRMPGRFRTVRALLSHMERAHMFLIPERDLCSDLPALLEFLRELVSEHHACLWCGQVFTSMHAVQQHMRARGHTRMRFDFELPQDEARVSDADRRIRALVEDFNEFYDLDGGEEDDGEEVVDEEETSEDGDWLQGLTDEDAYELVLPTGAAIGHRSLRRYWRQRVPLRTPAEQKRSQLHLRRLLGPYRALGFSGQLAQLQGVRGGALASIAGQGVMTARGGALVSRRAQQKAHKKRSMQALAIGIKGNLQKHHRDQYFI